MIKINKIKSIVLLLLNLLLIISCGPKDKFEWNAGISAPKNYISGGPFVEYFYQGNGVAGTSANVGINPGWGMTSGGYTGGEIFKPVPDSISVSWRCGLDLIEYKVGAKLPREKMLELFKRGKEIKGKKENYNQIITGMAPGGNVTVWLSGSFGNEEITRIKAKRVGETDKDDPNSVTLWTSTGDEAKDILKYTYLHGIPYSVWEKGEKTYQYDIGFSSEENRDFYESVTAFSKDGSYIFLNENQFIIPYKDWLSNHIMDGVKEGKLPVHTVVQWISEDDKQWYKGEIVFPVDFQNTFESFYQKNKNVHIVYVMDKLNPSGNYTFGTIWLQGSTSKERIMKFRLAKLNNETRKYEISKYTFPKGFVVPKWEGRIPLQRPTDLEYWQEE
ncbi:DUF2931 family protein [Chryseobacterium rhizosphaerae]|uniref:DUF2931 family protein n=1 Tax=Chryseobacterium rhizosphaerae TaxID=395937 RepID=A0ABX9ILD2_9FLAO|nr:DUF2931 family protein [Chryseobacterium rhizosphaerae]REC74880.1 DUF2931 family protein [Chryseobacterium rhizosphaerae]GEN67809.1 hypothetical protein CRH01_23770 [Chryseobacterium rhizosphaerae]